MLLVLACARPPAPSPSGPPGDSAGHSGHHPHHDSAATGHSGGTTPFDGPALLSAAGLYQDLAGEVLADGVVETTPRFPLWSDGSDKTRWLWVPPGGQIDTTDPDRWSFPVGTLAFKEFRVGGRRVETRRLAKETHGWEMVSYLWRADGTDADAVPEGVVDAFGTGHDVPDRDTCARCHDGPADLLLGVDAVQLDAAQQQALPLTAPVAGDVPGDAATQAALGYLHGNCGGCHRPGALAGDRTTLWLELAVGLTDPAAAAAHVTGVDAPTRHEIDGTTVSVVPGDPDASQLYVRMRLRGLEGMPPVGSGVVDDAGSALVGGWIESLAAP